MLLRSVVLILLCSACGGTPIAFEADCGLLVEEGEFNATPEDIISCQRAAVKHQLTTCDLMQGVHLQFLATPTWTDSYGREVSGLTFFPGSLHPLDTFTTIQVGPLPAYYGAFIHELHHLGAMLDTDNQNHVGWENGTYLEIDLARTDARAAQ